MSNVITLHRPERSTLATRQTLLIRAFADHRRPTDDVFWLKENAELLGILCATGAKLGADALVSFDTFYGQIEDRLRFFPQYYRFLISI